MPPHLWLQQWWHQHSQCLPLRLGCRGSFATQFLSPICSDLDTSLLFRQLILPLWQSNHPLTSSRSLPTTLDLASTYEMTFWSWMQEAAILALSSCDWEWSWQRSSLMESRQQSINSWTFSWFLIMVSRRSACMGDVRRWVKQKKITQYSLGFWLPSTFSTALSLWLRNDSELTCLQIMVDWCNANYIEQLRDSSDIMDGWEMPGPHEQ